MPIEPSDDELLAELKRVRSDLGFRKWISLRVRIVIGLIAFDLMVSVLVVAAVLGVRHVQIENCHGRQQDRAAVKSIVDIATTPSGGPVDLTKIAGFDKLDTNSQEWIRNLSAELTKANPPGAPSLHDRLIANLPPIEC